jgi:hypothetical protein
MEKETVSCDAAGSMVELLENVGPMELYPTKQKMLKKLFELLGLDVGMCKCIPIGGLKDVTTKKRSLRTAARIIDLLVTEICCLVVSNAEDSSFVKAKYRSVRISEDAGGKLQTKLATLAFFGSRNTSIVAQSVLSHSLNRTEAKQLLLDEYNALDDAISKAGVLERRRAMGKVKFASLRRTFAILAMGNDVPKHNYTFRIDAAKISPVITYLQESLQVKPGYVRDINVAGHVFTAMPVYERGGKTKESLFKSYKDALQDPLLRVGEQTFLDILKLITKRGETKAGLSTYYIRMRYSSQTFLDMLTRLRELECFDNGVLIVNGTLHLQEEWENLQQFIMWSYSNQHLQISDTNAPHCCTYALGGECDHEHVSACGKCSRLATFFDTSVATFLKDIVLNQLNDSDVRPEIDTMIAAVPRFTCMVKHYSAHRLRAKVQFYEIHKLKEEWLKADSSRFLIVMDHKQKVLGMKYREGQVEYFGKKGMSLLGTMQVRWVVDINGDGGFQYAFVDYVVKGYSGQDHIQVCAVIQQMVQLIQEKQPETKEVCFQSDNATCFASQELIPFVYHLNGTSDGPKVRRWIFTEAQTGRGRLDTHFSYLNVVMKSYVEDGNDIDVEEDIFKALSYNGGVAGTTAVLLDASNLEGPVLSRTFKVKTGSRATHEIKFINNDSVEIITSSGVTKPEVIGHAKLMNYCRKHLLICVQQQYNSPKAPLFTSPCAGQDADPSAATELLASSSKAQAYRNALALAGIEQKVGDTVHDCESPIEPIPPQLQPGWAEYPGNTGQRLSASVMQKLNELYMLGNVNKKRKVSADRALQILLSEKISDDWMQQIDVTVPKIKAFFQMPPSKQVALIKKHSLEEDNDFNERVEEEECSEVYNKDAEAESSMLDLY